MGFMEAEMTDKTWWAMLDGNAGVTAVPSDVLSDAQRTAARRGDPAPLAEYYEGTPTSVTWEFGYGVRSQAPGYMDCTEWTVYRSLKEAEKAYRAEARACQAVAAPISTSAPARVVETWPSWLALRARVSDLEQAIRFVLSNRPGHYTHVDPKGTAGRNCPACISDGLNCSTLREALCANKPTNTPGGLDE